MFDLDPRRPQPPIIAAAARFDKGAITTATVKLPFSAGSKRRKLEYLERECQGMERHLSTNQLTTESRIWL
jgi:hypothetical protein